MAVIFIETIPIANAFQLQRTLYVGYAAMKDWLEEYVFEDRLRAAIYNFGVGAKYLIENYADNNNSIGILSDNDGKDVKYDGEHNTLFSLLYPYNDFQARKLASLYANYNSWLLRAKELIWIGKLHIKLIEAGGDLIDRFYKDDVVKGMNRKPIQHYRSNKLGWLK